MSDNTVVVTLATGKTGRRVAQQLEDAGVDVRRASRRSAPPFDWDEPSTWDAVLDGARAAYVAPREGSLAVADFVAAAERHGLDQVVLLSARGVTTPGYYDDQDVLAAQFLDGEQATRESGMRWTILRPGWFMQNFDEGAFADEIHAGELSLPIASGSAAFIDAEDIAAVAVAAFADPDRLHGAELELTGPEAISMPDAVERVARATGRPIRYREITADEYHDRLVAAGTPEHEARVATIALSPIRAEREGVVTSSVADVLDRPAASFDDHVRRAFG